MILDESDKSCKCFYRQINIVMGNCTKCSVHKDLNAQILEHDYYDKQPDDTEMFRQQNLPTLTFYGLFRKFKLKNLNPQVIMSQMEETYGVKISIDQIQEFLLCDKYPEQNGQIKWQIQQKFIIQCTEYEIRKKFILIEVLDSQKTVIGFLKINLYLIAVGPYHLDFAIDLKGTKQHRVSFDIKIAQSVAIKIQPQLLEMYDINQFIGDQYAYSVKTIVGNSPVSQELSYTYQIQEKQTKNIKWSREVSPQMPGIVSQIPFYQFHYGTLKFLFWRIKQMGDQRVNEICGQCYISFVKLLSFDSVLVQRQNRWFEQKTIQLVSKLWNHGAECGKIRLQVNFEIEKHLKQMLVCVRTEKGICKTSPVFKANNTKNKVKSQEIARFLQIFMSLNNAEQDLEKNKTNNLPACQRKANLIQIEACLQEIYELLQKSKKETIMIYNYFNEIELLEGQRVLLEIGNRVLGYMDDEQFEMIENLKWAIIRQLIKRGQFELNYIGFHNKELKMGPKIHQQKVQIALHYQEFLYRLLGFTFKILGIKRYDEERAFAELYCAVAYFRIPQFRQKIIQLITKQDDPEIQEWRGTDFNLRNNNQQFKTFLPGQNTFEILFDWDKYFYHHLEKNPKYALNMTHLQELMNEKPWQNRIIKRRGAFFAFIKQWVDYVERASVRIVHSNWKHFPGYIDIIRTFLIEMKLKPIKSYPSSIKLALRSLLANQNLLNIFVTIIFKKTDIFKNVDVLKVLQLINSLFLSLRSRNKRIPSTFNYEFFFAGIKTIIENQYSYTTAKTLYVMYEHFQFFSDEFKTQVVNYLLGNVFFNLFLHWCHNVRIIFHHLLIIKIYFFITEAQKTNNHLKNLLKSFSERYNQLLLTLQNAKISKQKDFVPTYDKTLYIKLKKKMDKMKSNGSKRDRSCNNIESKHSLSLKEIQSKASSQQQQFDSRFISMNILEALEKSKRKQKSQKDRVIRKPKSEQASSSVINYKEFNDSTISYQEFNIPQQVTIPRLSQSNIKYILVSMEEFSTTSQQYLKSLRDLDQTPDIKPILAIDSSQMRPEEYGEIQEW